MIKNLITSDQHILGGKPVIAGTRIPLSRILFLLKDGYTVEAIHEEYPHVTTETLYGVMQELIQNIDHYAHVA